MKTNQIAEKAKEVYPQKTIGSMAESFKRSQRSAFIKGAEYGYQLCNEEWQEKLRWKPMEKGTYPEVRDKFYRILLKSKEGFISIEGIHPDYTHRNFKNLSMFCTHWREIIE